jgi:hypothetical protein
MKLQNKLTFAIVFIAILVVFSFYIKKIASVDVKNETRLEDLKAPEKATAVTGESAPRAKSEKTTTLSVEFKKCFNKEIKNENFDGAVANLMAQKDFSQPVTSEENYELMSAENQPLVVQYLPQEDNSNKVRVFSINTQDGFPDRIKDFPQSHAETSLKLKGALSLGEIKSKMISTTQTAFDGSMLSIDKKDQKVIRAHLITRSFDFECKNQSCLCLKKE